MIVELICVGTELLLGNITNTNARYLAEQCAALGLSMYYQSVVGDNQERLHQQLMQAKERADIILVCGGLGPTQDDLTKETAATAMEQSLVMDEKAKTAIAEYMGKRNISVTENNWKQALVPENGIVLYNENGTAPGIIMETQDTKMVLLPGPPNELIPMFEEQVVPYLKKIQPEVICSKTIKLCGIGESAAETQILDLIESQTNPTIATYAKTGEVHLRLTAKAKTNEAAVALIEPLAKEISRRFSELIYTDDEKVTLEQHISALLKKYQLTLSTAESCTGGLLAGRLINVPGISEHFKEGYITYANESKEKLLGVSNKTLADFGAVSEETAREMALGCKSMAQADIGIGITGIAGPDGGTIEKPIGLVYMGCSFKEHVYVKKFIFSGNRGKIRETAVSNALIFIREVILKEVNA